MKVAICFMASAYLSAVHSTLDSLLLASTSSVIYGCQDTSAQSAHIAA